MTFSLADIHRVGEILALAARTEIMSRFRNLQAAQIRQKASPFDLVTEADEAAEKEITARLKAAFPSALVVGEENTHANPGLLDGIATAELAFIVDPIDGTKNFASNLPLFGVMAAITERGAVAGGVIHDPVCRDSANALRGGGAWMEFEDGTRTALRVAAPAPVAQMEAFVGTKFLPEAIRDTVMRNLSRLGSFTWLRCAAHEYRLAASGHCHLLFGRV